MFAGRKIANDCDAKRIHRSINKQSITTQCLHEGYGYDGLKMFFSDYAKRLATSSQFITLYQLAIYSLRLFWYFR